MQSNPARTRDFRRLLELIEGTTVMRAISLVLPKDDGDDEEPQSLPGSTPLMMANDEEIQEMQASCTTP